MATVTPVNPNYYSDEVYSSNRTPTNELGKDQFLEILSVQLANQDPLEPVKDTDFIAQMAQFSSLEQMQAVATSTATNQAYNMIGKDVYGEVLDANGVAQQIIGRVVGVSKKDGEDHVIIGDFMVPMSSVKQVYDSGINNETLLTQSANMIGKKRRSGSAYR